MAKIEFKGIEDYSKQLDKLGRTGLGIIKAAVYVGADEIADSVRQSIESLPTMASEKSAIIAWRQDVPSEALTQKQKDGLLQGLGLSPMQEKNGFVYTKLGFAGYNDVRTKSYPNGQPNSLIARSLESGSSARKKHPFVRPAANRARGAAVDRMAGKVDEMLTKAME